MKGFDLIQFKRQCGDIVGLKGNGGKVDLTEFTNQYRMVIKEKSVLPS